MPQILGFCTASATAHPINTSVKRERRAETRAGIFLNLHLLLTKKDDSRSPGSDREDPKQAERYSIHLGLFRGIFQGFQAQNTESGCYSGEASLVDRMRKEIETPLDMH